ncbi:alpha-ribazole phosphatase [Sphingomonas laterariae]|uniref:Alpha-ribazole phosphatase n=1 Tax=Edaphosphingomonas laterariae TaxID=861865 RepID=A0A239K9N9_9SPHN|nr:histidine phosphatase family protein [Sphingomonas laterariae]SNT15097.1 alpha-ribazole phosphatase [Sphingomonas laterariae]
MSGYLLHLLRHGAPERPGLLLGRTDSAATAQGIADCLAQVEGLHFERLVTSDLARCRDTAAAIGAARIDPRWRELDFGAWDGRAAAEIDPAAIGAFWDDPDANPPPDGERWSALVARIDAAIGALDPVDTLVVTHGGAIRAALALLCGFRQRDLWAFDLPYAALLTLRIWPGDRPSAQIIGLC